MTRNASSVPKAASATQLPSPKQTPSVVSIEQLQLPNRSLVLEESRSSCPSQYVRERSHVISTLYISKIATDHI